MKLYEITKSLQKLTTLLDKEEDITKFLDGVKMQLQEKAKNIFYYMKEFDDNTKAIDNEIKRLQEMKKYHDRQYNKLKEYISYSMQNAGIEKIETDIVKFSFRKSEQVEAKIEDLPKKYIKEVVSLKPDKVSIKKDIKEGKEIKGAEIKTIYNLQIK